ncbi:hypothetical protein HAX54_030368 [Datura stramonium]|uniref:Oxidoreductase-like domain-containing protein n=1 Tax=Datura stramonium TaxID=4076 RepID=A0ABS8RLK1_DATST|nr:hypothetical protein [Datura stramonium]
MALSGFSLSKTVPLRANLCPWPPKNVQRASAFLMPITDLTFGRIHTVNPIRFRHPSVRNIAALKSPMAEEANHKSTIESTMGNMSTTKESTMNNKTDSEKNQEKPKVTVPPPPPPPEKPLPGDCCGSGCVRCVWDMYYEELEEYNKLYKSNPDVKP